MCSAAATIAAIIALDFGGGQMDASSGPPHLTVLTRLVLVTTQTHINCQAIREELSKEFTTKHKEKVWSEAVEAVKRSYDQPLGRWKEEMDTLLIYVSVIFPWTFVSIPD